MGLLGGGQARIGYVGGGEVAMERAIYGRVKSKEVSGTKLRTTCLNRASLGGRRFLP